MELVQARDESPAREFAGTRPDLAATLYDGRQVVGRQRDGQWTICVYASAGDDRLLGYATASTRLSALQHAGLSGDDAGEVLGRAGI